MPTLFPSARSEGAGNPRGEAGERGAGGSVNDRMGASLIITASGLALGVFWYRLTREQRDALVQGLTGKRPVGSVAASPVAARPSPAKGPFVGPPSPGAPRTAPQGDWLDEMKARFNRTLENTEDIMREYGVKPPYPIKPFPR
jgi:hypothetical protein